MFEHHLRTKCSNTLCGQVCEQCVNVNPRTLPAEGTLTHQHKSRVAERHNFSDRPLHEERNDLPTYLPRSDRVGLADLHPLPADPLLGTAAPNPVWCKLTTLAAEMQVGS